MKCIIKETGKILEMNLSSLDGTSEISFLSRFKSFSDSHFIKVEDMDYYLVSENIYNYWIPAIEQEQEMQDVYKKIAEKIGKTKFYEVLNNIDKLYDGSDYFSDDIKKAFEENL